LKSKDRALKEGKERPGQCKKSTDYLDKEEGGRKEKKKSKYGLLLMRRIDL